MDDEKRQAYRDAWNKPGALTAMLNWYRASPVIVPAEDEEAGDIPLMDIDPEIVRVRMPHLVVWGEEDAALRPSVLDGLDDLHDRVQTMMPESRMPQFTTVAMEDHVVLEYHSDRAGLAPMVRGLLVGLQDFFEESWSIEQTGHAAVDGFDSFTLKRAQVLPGERAA